MAIGSKGPNYRQSLLRDRLFYFPVRRKAASVYSVVELVPIGLPGQPSVASIAIAIFAAGSRDLQEIREIDRQQQVWPLRVTSKRTIHRNRAVLLD